MREDTHTYTKLRTGQGCEVHPKGNSGFSDYEDPKKSGKKKKKSSITPLEFRDQTVACWVSAWRNHICYVCPEKRSPNELVDFQKSAPPSSRTVYPNEQEIKQRLQEVCMDKQGTPHKIRHKKATYKKRKQCHVTRRNKETLAEHTTMGLIKVKLTCS